jgi:hypothetical protein
MELFWTEEASGEHWGLGPLASSSASIALLGWAGAAEDGGVPRAVAAVLATGLTAFGQVTFPSGVSRAEGPSGTAGVQRARPTSPAALDRIAGAALRRGPAELPLVSTTDARIAASLFDDAAFPWWAQAQAILLSSSSTPPTLTESWPALARLFTPAWADALAGLRAVGIEAIARPSVDGDVVGFACATTQVRDRLRGCLFRAAGEAGLAATRVGLEDFNNGIAGSPPG